MATETDPLKLCDELIARCNRMLRAINNPDGPSAKVFIRDMEARCRGKRRVVKF